MEVRLDLPDGHEHREGKVAVAGGDIEGVPEPGRHRAGVCDLGHPWDRGDARGFRRSTRCVRDRRHQDAGDPRNDEQGEEAATHSEGGSYRGEAPRLGRARRTSVRAMSTL